MFNRQKVQKFALVGAQCVGKTTILNILKEKFIASSHIKFIDEGARIFFESNPQITDRSAIVQKQIQNFVLEREKEAYTAQTEIIVSDRSVVDPVILATIWDTQDNAEKLHTTIVDWLSTYTIFFILSPQGVPSIVDPKRRETESERFAIHEGFIKYCKQNNVAYVEITGTLAERVERIQSTIFEKNTTEENEL